MGKENESLELTLDEVKSLITAEVAKEGKAAAESVVEEFKKEGLNTEMKKIFPAFGEEGDMSGGSLKSRSGSVLDMS
jgi:hypothetical protein